MSEQTIRQHAEATLAEHPLLEDDWGGERSTPKLKCGNCGAPYPCRSRQHTQAILDALDPDVLQERMVFCLNALFCPEPQEDEIVQDMAQWTLIQMGLIPDPEPIT